jgi:hypothetical protein
LRDFEAVGQADAEMIAIGGDEHLGLVAQAAEGGAVDDAVAVALEGGAGGGQRFRVTAAARVGGVGGIAGAIRRAGTLTPLGWRR